MTMTVLPCQTLAHMLGHARCLKLKACDVRIKKHAAEMLTTIDISPTAAMQRTKAQAVSSLRQTAQGDEGEHAMAGNRQCLVSLHCKEEHSSGCTCSLPSLCQFRRSLEE